MKPFTLEQSLGWLHGRKKRDIYVLISDDGSTLVQMPGGDMPWSTPNKLYAETTAANLRSQVPPVFCRAVTLETALGAIIKHPKNQPQN